MKRPNRCSGRITVAWRIAFAWLLAIPIAWAAGTSTASTSRGANDDLLAPYAYHVSGGSPLNVLERFANDHGLRLRLAPASQGRHPASWRTARLAGWLRAESGRDFLEQLASAWHFDWFVANRSLYVSTRADAMIERIALHGLDADAAQAALSAIGLYDARFGWGPLPGQDAVLVSGPRAYVALVRRYLASRNSSARDAPQVEPMIFALRYAQAADGAPFDSRESSRAGVASILRELIAGEERPSPPRFPLPTARAHLPVPALPVPPAPASPLPMDGNAFADWFGTTGQIPPLPDWRTTAQGIAASRRATEIVIAADERTNTVLVWGDPALRLRIQRLIDALDKPQPMVAMEVIVVECDEAILRTLTAGGASDAHTAEAGRGPQFDIRWAAALDAKHAQLLNRQRLVGFANRHLTLAIGAQALHGGNDPNQGGSDRDNGNGRAGHRGDTLDLIARMLPDKRPGRLSIAVDVGLLMAQPTGLPGQQWASTSSVALKTSVALEQRAAPRLVATYPVASARERQRAVFISAEAL